MRPARCVVRSVVYCANVRTQREVDDVLALCGRGLTTSEIARLLGIPRSTVRDWRKCPPPPRQARGCGGHDPSSLDQPAYAYVLGMYLGDGCISAYPRGVWRLRITLDSVYPGIVAECVRAVGAVTPGRVNVLRRRNCRAAEVSNYWKHWACVIPQQGPGRKHERPIVLAEWQRQVVSAHPEPFLRGLIHSDGTRIIATERKGAYSDVPRATRSRTAPRAFLSTRSSQKQISVYSKAAVARLDEFVGPKD